MREFKKYQQRFELLKNSVFRHICLCVFMFIICVSGAYSADYTPTWGDSSVYTLTPQSSSTGTNVISAYVFDEVSKSVMLKYYKVDLRNATYGSSGTVVDTFETKLPYDSVTVTVDSDASVGTRNDSAGTYAGEVINKNFFENEGNRSNSYIDNYYGNNTLRDVYGGALVCRSKVERLTGDFINNCVTSPGRGIGGAIYVRSYFGYLNANFIGNYVQATERGAGGAVALHGWNGSVGPLNYINGDFIGNYVVVDKYYANGGAIANENSDDAGSTINFIKGDFIGNYVLGNSSSACGGAICNSLRSTIGRVSQGLFIGNYAESNYNYARGGAICNNGTIYYISNASFTNNYVKSAYNEDVHGGAIYSVNDIYLTVRYYVTSVIAGNYTETAASGKQYEAIYMANADSTLTFYAAAFGNYVIDDYVDGQPGYDVRFIGDDSGTVYLHNDMKNADVSANTVTMDLSNGDTREYNFRSLKSDNSTKWIIDFDISNERADSIKTEYSAPGVVTLEDINIIVGSFDNVAGNFKVQILDVPTDELQLALSDNVIAKFGTNDEQYLGTRTADVAYIEDTVTTVTNWTDVFNKYRVTNLVSDVYGKLGLATTNTTNDSIGYSVTRTETSYDGTPTLVGSEDALVVAAKAPLATRSFVTYDDEAVHVVNTTAPQITTSAGTFTISGVKTADSISTIDLNDNIGFVLDEQTTLNIYNTKITNGYENLITVNNSDVEINLMGAYIDGNIIGTENFDLSISGASTTTLNGNTYNVALSNSGTAVNNGTITGTVTNSGNFTNNGAITGNISNTGVMTSSASDLGGAISNTGTLYLSGTLNKTVTQGGTTVVDESLTMGSNGHIAGTLDLNDGTLSLSPGSISNNIVGTITGDGNLIMDVNYNGSSVVTDTLTAGGTDNSVLTIVDLNRTGSIREFTYTVLTGTNTNVELRLADSVVEEYRIVDNEVSYYSDVVQPETDWSDQYEHHVVVVTTTKDLTVADGTTLTYAVTGTTTTDTTTSEGDTLALVTQSGIPERSFNTSDPEAEYSASNDLGEAGAGRLDINGATDDQGNRSTIDLGTHKGFELTNETELNLRGTLLKGENVIIDVDHEDAVVNFDCDSRAEGDIDNAGTVNFDRGSSIEGDIDNAGTVNFDRGSSIAGNIDNSGTVNFETESRIEGDIDNSGTLNFNRGSTINGDIDNSGTVNGYGETFLGDINNDGDLNISGNIEGSITGSGSTRITGDTEIDSPVSNNVTVDPGVELSFRGTGEMSGGTLTMGGGGLNLQDGQIRDVNLGHLILTGDIDLKVDANFRDAIMDTISLTGFTGNGHSINLSNINITQPTTAKTFTISPFGNITDPDLKQQLADALECPEDEVAYSPIFKYKPTYDKDTGLITFTRLQKNRYDSYNPAVVVGPVAAQLGGYFVMVNSYDEAFRNMDMRMMMTKAERTALKFANKIAVGQAEAKTSESDKDSVSDTKKLGPAYRNIWSNYPDLRKGLWSRTYTIFERVNLDNGPKVSNVMYGTFFGGDSDIKELKHGWDYQSSFYIAYNGSHQAYQGNDIYQNGGMLGATAIWYKGDFYTAITANVAGNVAEANTRYGSEDFPMIMAGVASKTGYNWELKEGKYIIQPNFLISYSFVNTFNFTNSQHLRITSSPLHGINIAPGLKLIANLKNGWQPYISFRMVWNILDKSDFAVVDLTLPEMSVKPYFQYGFGLQKRWGDRFTGYIQAMMRNGGRNGVALSVGLRWAIGSDE